MGIREISTALANYSGLLDAYMHLRRPIKGSQAIILFYHRVAPKTDNWSINPTNPLVFRRQIEYVCRHYEVIALNELVRCVEQKKALPNKAVVITFDDGYKDNYNHAFPIIVEHKIPAVIFVATRSIETGELLWTDKVRYTIHHTDLLQISIDGLGAYSLVSSTERARACVSIVEHLKHVPETRRITLLEKLTAITGVNTGRDLGKELTLSWSEVKEMSANRVEIGAHTVTHPILTNMPLKEAWSEILLSKQAIQSKIGGKVSAFCYPNGAYDSDVVSLVKKAGYSCAVGTSAHPVSHDDDLYTLGRISGGGLDRHSLKLLQSNLWTDVKSTLRVNTVTSDVSARSTRRF